MKANKSPASMGRPVLFGEYKATDGTTVSIKHDESQEEVWIRLKRQHDLHPCIGVLLGPSFPKQDSVVLTFKDVVLTLKETRRHLLMDVESRANLITCDRVISDITNNELRLVRKYSNDSRNR